ncbi:flavoprotein [Neobacillus sp. Marseille-QA0830]
MQAEGLLDRIVEEVLKRLQKKMKKATVLFTGGASGFEESLQQLKLLVEDGWDLNVLLSQSAEYVLKPAFIKEQLGVSTIHVEKEMKGLKPYYEGISALIIPTLTLNTAVKISVGISDTMSTNLASHVIMEGIPIIAAKDACDMQNPIRKQLGLHKAPKAYLQNMNEHLQTLESYGAVLVEAKDLYEAVKQNVFTFSPRFEEQPNRPQKMRVFKKKVLARSDIIEAKQKQETLSIPKNSIISPLALETAKELGVTIIQDS